MTARGTPWRPVPAAEPAWDPRGNPFSPRFEDVYFNRDDGVAESRHTFLQASQLAQRWSRWAQPHFTIGELGFGTGLNFLLSWQLWRAQPAPRPDLHYLSIDKHPLHRDDLATALQRWPELTPLAQELLDVYPGLLPGQHRVLLDAGRVRLDLHWQSADTALAGLAALGEPLIDAWYLDGFAPTRNPDMWSENVLATTATLSRSNASVATFSSAGQVRRALQNAGFVVEKTPGYGRKRECLRGRLSQRPATAHSEHSPVAARGAGAKTAPAENATTPWDRPARKLQRPQHVLIVGAGLAGCTTAAALARRGIAVTVLDQGGVATAASGNAQGILYTRVAQHHSPQTDFGVTSYTLACAWYRQLFTQQVLRAARDGALCGCFQVANNESVPPAEFRQSMEQAADYAQWLPVEAAAERLGVTPGGAGWWLPGSGWIYPAALCRALLASTADNAIEVITHCGPLRLERQRERWRAVSATGVVAAGDAAIIAAGTGTSELTQCQWLPLQAVRGQTTTLPLEPPFNTLRAALCQEGYIAPADTQNQLSIGATFATDDTDIELRARDHRQNLAQLTRAIPGWQSAIGQLNPTALKGRVGFRCASPDRLPILGRIPDLTAFTRDYAALRRDAKRVIPTRGSYLPGLYVNTAHGSRGLTSTPLAAELLASMLCHEPLPLPREQVRALAPARFIIRALARNQL